MAAAITDLITDTFNSANPNVAKVTAGRTAGALSLSCDNLAGWPTVAAVHFSTYKIDTTGAVVAGSQIDWKGLVAGNTIGTMTRKAGATDAGNAIGDIVEMNPTGSWGHDLYNGIRAHANQDGSLITTAVNTALAAATSTNEAGSTMMAIRNETQFDFVASGGVWSGDAYASTKAASMTALVCYQAGQRLTVSAVTARTFTASEDTYIDVLNTAGVGSLVYTEVANNAASPALAASSIRIGIIVTGATNIAAATSVNQGQETMVLPIASSIPYAVTDSLGNLICPRDPNRKILGLRQSNTQMNSMSSSITLVPGQSAVVIAPTGRKIKVSANMPSINNLSASSATLNLFNAATITGNPVAQATLYMPTAGTGHSLNCSWTGILTGTQSFCMGAATSATAGGTATYTANVFSQLTIELA